MFNRLHPLTFNELDQIFPLLAVESLEMFRILRNLFRYDSDD